MSASHAPQAKKPPQELSETSKELSGLVNELRNLKLEAEQITISFQTSPFAKKLETLKTELKASAEAKGWQAISVGPAHSPKTLQDLVFEFYDKQVTQLFKEIHQEALRGELFKPKRWEKKLAELGTEFSGLIENEAGFSKQLLVKQRALQETAKAVQAAYPGEEFKLPAQTTKLDQHLAELEKRQASADQSYSIAAANKQEPERLRLAEALQAWKELKPEDQDKLATLEASIPRELQPVFLRMKEASLNLQEIKQSSAFRIIAEGDEAKGIPPTLSNSVEAENLAKRVANLATEVFHQELSSFHLSVECKDGELFKQIDAATAYLNQALEDRLRKFRVTAELEQQNELDQKLAALSQQPDKEKFEGLMNLAEKYSLLQDTDPLKRLAIHRQTALEIQQETSSPAPSSKTLQNQLRRLQEVSELQFEEQANWYVAQIEKKANRQLENLKTAQAKQLNEQQKLQNDLDQQAQILLQELQEKLAAARNHPDQQSIQRQIDELTRAQREARELAELALNKKRELQKELQAKADEVFKALAEQLAFMRDHLKKQKSFLQTTRLRRHWQWKTGSKEYYALGSRDAKGQQQNNLYDGREEHKLMGGWGTIAKLEPDLIYISPESKYEVALEEKDGRYLARVTNGESYYGLTGFKSALYKDKRREELDLLVAAGETSVTLTPTNIEGFKKHYSGDQDLLTQMLGLRLDLLAERQLNVFELDKRPAEEELQQFKNSFLIVGSPGNRSFLYIDEEGEIKQDQVLNYHPLKPFGATNWPEPKETNDPSIQVAGGKVKRLTLTSTLHLDKLRALNPTIVAEMMGKTGLDLNIPQTEKELASLVNKGLIRGEQAQALSEKLSALARQYETKKHLLKSRDQIQVPAEFKDDPGRFHAQARQARRFSLASNAASQAAAAAAKDEEEKPGQEQGQALRL